ncbi:MAG: methyl-accepting chemotaxis protein [Desulfobulbus sp.]|uniref:methyl-accepting chemotaxis protein n=1 Tax=Desulfobulbus sp. TaxID=895 RepID=UPI0028460106|nr:methyl-accepting chemotaxis protein [Desulfobulbus sp.]MDR2550945.1 methyl-accepting chemotaxis protein [Desulfobulbus sp.]
MEHNKESQRSLKKMFVVFSLGVGVLLIAAIALQKVVNDRATSANDAQVRRYLSYLIANEFRQSSSSLTNLCRTYAATGDKKYSDAYWQIVDWQSGKAARPADVHPLLHPGKRLEQKKIMEELGFSQKELSLLEKARANSDGLIATEAQAMKVVAAGAFAEGPWKMKEGEQPREFAVRILFDENYHAAVDSIMKPVNDFFTELDARTGAEADRTNQALHTYVLIAILLEIGVALLMAGMVVVLMRSVFSPLDKLSALMQDIAQGEGDLTKRLLVRSNDEIGRLARFFNIFVEKLQGVIASVASNVETLAASSDSMTTVSKQLSSAAQETSGKSSSVAEASEQMTVNFQSVSASMEQSTANVSIIAASTEEMTATVNEIAESAEKARAIADAAVQQSTTTSVKMRELEESAQKIGKVTETITEISEQTNLLALNATIEAARAGDAGKGFAVVANEIKELAKQTADATVDIKNQIGEMQTTTNATIEDMAAISKVIVEINSVINAIATAVEEQSAATNEIAGNIAQASQGIAEVNENVSLSTEVVSAISRDIHGINQQSLQVDEGAGQVLARAQELAALAEQLEQLVNKFSF